MESIMQAFREGGFWMWPILFAQIAAIAIIIERVIALYVGRSTNARKLVASIEGDIQRGQIERAQKKASSFGSDSAVRKVVEAGTGAALSLGGRDEVQAKMDEVLFHEQTRLETRVEFLAMLGNVATLMGLLGTIVGMIRAFSALSNVDQTAKAAMLAQGISEAMHATAYGLIVAIPTLVMYSILQNRVNKLSEDLTEAALRLYNLLGFQFENVKAKKVK